MPPARRNLWVFAECRRGSGAWAKERWCPVAVSVEAPADARARLLHSAPERDLWLLGEAPLELHKSDAASYRFTLAQPEPMLFVALRACEGPVPMRIELVTAASDEAQSMLEGGDDVVEPVPMPAEVRDWIEAFVAQLPEPEPFRKRERKRYDPETAGVGRRDTDGRR